jgi:hypothetical protein
MKHTEYVCHRNAQHTPVHAIHVFFNILCHMTIIYILAAMKRNTIKRSKLKFRLC